MTESLADYFEILAHHARVRGDKVALTGPGQQVTYAGLNEHIGRFGNLLRDMGVGNGERVVLALPDGPDFFFAFFGAMKCGAVPVPLSPDLSGREYGYVLQDCGASALVTVGACPAASQARGALKMLLVDDEACRPRLAAAAADLAPHPAAPEQIAFLLYSSGSTGNPKGVPHSQRDMLFCARQYAGKVLQMSERDVVFSASKLFFAYGLGNSLIFPLYFGATTVLFDRKPGPGDIFRIIDRFRPTLLYCVPTLYNMLLKTMTGPVSLPSLRLCVSAGEALPASAYHAWKELTGLEILDGIGSTEALHIFISNRPGDVRPGSSGFVVPGYEARICGEDSLPVPAGQQGILHIRGKSTAQRYWDRPEKTAQTMLAGGWLNTGDYYLEDGGCYTYQGRQDDMFKAGGAWVSPLKVEEAMRDHPAVLECAVTTRKLEGLVKPLAYVVLKPGFTGDMKLTREMRGRILERLPDYMCPVQFNYVQEIPKTGTGKVQRYILREGDGA